MNAYQLSQSLGLTGTDAEIVAQVQATGLTARPINRADLIRLLNFRKMLQKIVDNSDEKWQGTVLNMQTAILAEGTQEQKDGVRLWFSHVTNPTNETWDTTQTAYAAPFWQMYTIFADGLGMPTSEDFAAVAALGGGWLYANLTVEQFAAQRAEAQQQLAAETLSAEWAALQNDGGINAAVAAGDRAALVTALTAAADAIGGV